MLKKLPPMVFEFEEEQPASKKSRRKKSSEVTVTARPMTRADRLETRRARKAALAAKAVADKTAEFRAIQAQRDVEWSKPLRVPSKLKRGVRVVSKATPRPREKEINLDLSFGVAHKENQLPGPFEKYDAVKVAVHSKGKFVENLYARVTRVNANGKIIARIEDHIFWPHVHGLERHSKVVLRRENVLRHIAQPKWIDGVFYERLA